MSDSSNMADYGGAISLSQAHTSENDESSDHSPRSVPTFSGSIGGGNFSGSSSKSKNFTTNNGGSTAEISKKPRGRPPGSKNKPKPPIVITKDNDSSLKPVIIEISAGSDIVDTLIQFARKRQVGIYILSASGSVSKVILKHPNDHAPCLSLNGPFSLVSLSGSFLCSSSSKQSSFCFGICLAGAQGQVFGGIIGGKVVAASLVVVVAATFLNPTFHKLPSDDNQIEEAGEVDKNEHSAAAAVSSADTTMAVYNNVVSPTAINSQIATPHSGHLMQWAPNSHSPYS